MSWTWAYGWLKARRGLLLHHFKPEGTCAVEKYYGVSALLVLNRHKSNALLVLNQTTFTLTLQCPLHNFCFSFTHQIQSFALCYILCHVCIIPANHSDFFIFCFIIIFFFLLTLTRPGFFGCSVAGGGGGGWINPPLRSRPSIAQSPWKLAHTLPVA